MFNIDSMAEMINLYLIIIVWFLVLEDSFIFILVSLSAFTDSKGMQFKGFIYEIVKLKQVFIIGY